MSDNKQNNSWKWIYSIIIVLAAMLIYRSLDRKQKFSSDSSELVSENLPGQKSRNSVEATKTEDHILTSDQDKSTRKIISSMSEEKTISIAEVEKLRSQAKSHLAALYSAQKAFYAEHKRYTTDLELIGWQPMTADLNFKLGFLNFNTPAKLAFNEDGSRMTTDVFLPHNEYESDKPIHYSALAENIDLQDYEYLCKEKCTANNKGFEALVVIPLGNSKQVDIWIVNHKKEIIHIVDGLK